MVCFLKKIREKGYGRRKRKTHLKRIEPAATVDCSLGRVLKNQAEEKARELRALIRYNQTRYRMSVEAFYSQRIKDQDHTWEDEETYFDWLSAHHALEEMEQEMGLAQ